MTKIFRFLFIEDNEIDQLAFKDTIKKYNLSDLIFDTADSIKEAKKFLTTNNYDLIVSDFWLGDGDGMELMNFKKSTPIIFITGMGDEMLAVKLMKEGAVNYIVKDLNSNYLHYLVSEIISFKKLKLENGTNLSKELKNDLFENSIGLVFYLNKNGPVAMNKPTKYDFSELNFQKMANFFYLAIGQGNERNIGLYELPVPGYPNLTAIVYATEIKDKDYTDPRSPGINYILLTLIVPKKFKHLLPHSSELESIFAKEIKNYSALSDLSRNELFLEILSAIMNK